MILKKVCTTITAIWDYIKPTWEGDDGRPSYRRGSQLVFIVLICYIVFTNASQSSWGFWTLLVLVLSFLLLAAIITADQILKGINGLNSFTSSITREADTSQPDKTVIKTTVENKLPEQEEHG